MTETRVPVGTLREGDIVVLREFHTSDDFKVEVTEVWPERDGRVRFTVRRLDSGLTHTTSRPGIARLRKATR